MHLVEWMVTINIIMLKKNPTNFIIINLYTHSTNMELGSIK